MFIFFLCIFINMAQTHTNTQPTSSFLQPYDILWIQLLMPIWLSKNEIHSELLHKLVTALLLPTSKLCPTTWCSYSALDLSRVLKYFLFSRLSYSWGVTIFQMYFITLLLLLASPGGSDDKESSCDVQDPGLIPGSGRSLGEGNGNPLQSSCLENPMDEGASQAIVHGVVKSWTRLSNWAHTYISK